MATVIVAREKHGTFVYESALKLLQERVEEDYWYEDWNDGDPDHQWEERARRVLASGSEMRALGFLELRDREGFEYESIEKQEVR